MIGTRSPDALARAGDPVVLLPDELAQDAIGSLRDPNQGLDVGTAQGVAEFNVTLRSRWCPFGGSTQVGYSNISSRY